MLDSSHQPISLVLSAPLYVAGEEVRGTVFMDFTELQSLKTPIEEVHVKLRGYVFTEISTARDRDSKRRQRVDLIRKSVSVYRRGTAYPAPNDHVLKLPFSFELPSRLPPSSHYRTANEFATVAYSLKVVGVRPGLHFNKRIVRPIPILPWNVRGAELSQHLRTSWAGEWRYTQFSKNVRKGMWGDFSRVTAMLALPAIEALPIFTPIPFTLDIATITKPVVRNVKDERCATIFPAPPATSQGVELTLMRRVSLLVEEWQADGFEAVVKLGGLGPKHTHGHLQMEDVSEDVIVETMEKVWISDPGLEKGERGSWKQETVFQGAFAITCPPSFDTSTMCVEYFLSVKVDIPGMGNDLRGEIPVKVVSSMLRPASGRRWDGPPLELDLPPAYFSSGADLMPDSDD